MVRLLGFKKKFPFEYYLVGGQVRDQLLGLTSSDYDYVVVGSTPDELKKCGLIQVGKSFPVFLDPNSQDKKHPSNSLDEYALARKEKKVGQSHQDFIFTFDPSITLKEDLYRRDFTVNALCVSEKGELIDYFHGLQDLEDKILRHVSEHFIEDPLRVFRAAKFCARLGFSLAPETLALCQKMVSSGAVKFLSMEIIKAELDDALKSHRFDVFVHTLRQMGAWEDNFSEDFLDPVSLNNIQDLESQWIAAGVIKGFSQTQSLKDWKNKYKLNNSIELNVKIFLLFKEYLKKFPTDDLPLFSLLSYFQDGKNDSLINSFSQVLKNLSSVDNLESPWIKFQKILQHFKNLPWKEMHHKPEDSLACKKEWLKKYHDD